MKRRRIREIEIFVIVILPLLFIIALSDSNFVSANSLEIIGDMNGDDLDIYPSETLFFTFYYDYTSDSQIQLDLMTLNSSNIELSVFTWNNYRPGGSNYEDTDNTAGGTTASVQLTCQNDHRYIVRLKYMTGSERETYNVTFTTDSGISIPADYYYFQEQAICPNGVAVSYFFAIDPWLYDSASSSDRATIMIGYQLYTPEFYVGASSERWFIIKNYLDVDITMFVGVNVYTLSTWDYDYPSATLGLTDWEDLSSGAADWLELEYVYRAEGAENYYSCGFNFTCEAGHTYQVWFKNDDSIYACFLNATFYSWSSANVKYDEDWRQESDGVVVRAFLYDPWLDYQQERRRVMWGWILGISIPGIIFSACWVKVRYL
ncbi:MAG: hypothetical protein GF364_12275 [Candidatus Lokiarchaeota archaeon]|nr:hypothetical protein [Candidatus Lokiarchaeota archaeon]